MYNKTIIGFGLRMVSRIIQTEVNVIRLGLDNSWYRAQPHPIIVYDMHIYICYSALVAFHFVTFYISAHPCIILFIYILGLQWIPWDLVNEGFRGHVGGKQNHKQKKKLIINDYFVKVRHIPTWPPWRNVQTSHTWFYARACDKSFKNLIHVFEISLQNVLFRGR